MTIHSALASRMPDFAPTSKERLRSLRIVPGVFLFLLLFTSGVFAQAPAIPGVTTLKLKSDVLGEERTSWCAPPAGYETEVTLSRSLHDRRRTPHIGHTAPRSSFSQETAECLS